MRVVPLEGREERVGYRVGGVAREGGGRVEVLDCGLGGQLEGVGVGVRSWRVLTPRYLSDHLEWNWDEAASVWLAVAIVCVVTAPGIDFLRFFGAYSSRRGGSSMMS